MSGVTADVDEVMSGLAITNSDMQTYITNKGKRFADDRKRWEAMDVLLPCDSYIYIWGGGVKA